MSLALSTTPALAGVLPVDGVYGNGAGCHLFATGERLNDGYLLLTPDTFASKPIGCDFDTLVSGDNLIFIVDAICSPGGKRQVTITDLGSDSFTIKLDAQTFVGPLKLCPEAVLPGSNGVLL